MTDFIRVLGPDPKDQSRNVRQFLNIAFVVRAVPVWGEEKDGKVFDCSEDSDGAKVVQYALYDAAGTKFLCSNKDDWKAMGLALDPGGKVFGFTMHKEK